MNTKIQFIEKISTLFNFLKDESSKNITLSCGNYIKHRPSGIDFSGYVNELYDTIQQLNDKSENDKFSLILFNLNHTIGKEVSEVEYFDEKATKEKAPKVRQRELENAMRKATLQISIDIWEILHLEQENQSDASDNNE